MRQLKHLGTLEIKERGAPFIFQGFYPRIHDMGLEPRQWLRGYDQTYIQRDIRGILNAGDLEVFGRFIRLCAGRNGQLLNLSSLGADCGITHSMVRRWTSILEASFLIQILRPHNRNFSKRMVKSPSSTSSTRACSATSSESVPRMSSTVTPPVAPSLKV